MIILGNKIISNLGGSQETFPVFHYCKKKFAEIHSHCELSFHAFCEAALKGQQFETEDQLMSNSTITASYI